MTRQPQTASALALIEHLENLRQAHCNLPDTDNQYTATDARARRESYATAIALLEAELPFLEEDAVALAIARGEVTRVQLAATTI